MPRPHRQKSGLGGSRVMWNKEAAVAGAGGALYSIPGTVRPGRYILTPLNESPQCRSGNCCWAKDLADKRAGLGEAGSCRT